MELIEIVDEDGNFTGEVMDKDEAHDKNLLHNEVSVLIINNKGQILMQKRSGNKRFSPNKWGFCSGHVKAYEKLKSAAIREVGEEVGLKLEENELIYFTTKKYIAVTNSRIASYYYAICNLKEKDFSIQEEELSEVKWFDIDEVIRMLITHDNSITFSENKIDVLRKLKEVKL